MRYLIGVLLAVSVSQTAVAQQQPASRGVVIPDNSCQMMAGPLGSAPRWTNIVDGSKLKDADDVKKLRSKAKDGSTIVVKGGNFSNQKFGNDNFTNICFVGTNLSGTKWNRSRGQGIGFIDSDLTGATFDRVALDYVLFRNTTLTRVDAAGAHMAYGQLDGGWSPSMASLKLDNARMVGFRFNCGVSENDGCAFDRKQISLRGADLSFANLATFPMWDAQYDDARLNFTEVGMDQMNMFGAAELAGPIIVRADQRKITLEPDAFRAAAAAVQGTRVADVECKTPDGPMSEIFCQAGQSALRAYRDDVERLYQSTLKPVTNTAGGAPIVVKGSDKVHGRYVKAMRRCALKGEGLAISCLATTMAKRREVLVAQLMKTRPLEKDAYALFVSVETPMVQAVASDPRLSAFSPLLYDSAPQVLLAYHDEDEGLLARGYMPSADGTICSASFNQKIAKSGSGRKVKRVSKTKQPVQNFAAWYSGAEFSIGQPLGKPKKIKKIKKPKRGSVAPLAPQPVLAKGCSSYIKSQPLIRVPISEDEFDKLWVARKDGAPAEQR